MPHAIAQTHSAFYPHRRRWWGTFATAEVKKTLTPWKKKLPHLKIRFSRDTLRSLESARVLTNWGKVIIFFVSRGTLETFRFEDENDPEYVIWLRVFSEYSQKIVRHPGNFQYTFFLLRKLRLPQWLLSLLAKPVVPLWFHFPMISF